MKIEKKISIILALFLLFGLLGAASRVLPKRKVLPHALLCSSFSERKLRILHGCRGGSRPIANEMAGQPVAFVEWEIAPRKSLLSDRRDWRWCYVPTVYVDSARLYAVDLMITTMNTSVSSTTLARPPQATLSFICDGWRQCCFTVTVTNNSNVTLSTANKAAVHGIVYEDYRAVKSDRIGRGSAKADITNLPPGATETYSFTVPISGVVDVSKLHFIALVDYKTTAKTNGIYDQLQATVAVPTGFVVSPSQLNFTFGALDPETPSDSACHG